MSITVVVKPHHLKGNSYTHSYERSCPLQEAINEQFSPKKYFVGGAYVAERGTGRSSYYIPEDWNKTTVTEYIRQANEGNIQEISVILE